METRQPFVLGIPIYRDFPIGRVQSDFVYHLSVPPTNENRRGGHAVAIIGYDETKHAFRMVNSWGEKWGDRGFLWLSEDFIANFAYDGWSAMPGGLIARDPKASIHLASP